MFQRALPIRVWGIGLLFIVGLGVAFYLVLGRGAESSTTEQLLRRQQTVARAQASNLISFFQVFGESIAVLSQFSNVEHPDAQTVQDMDAFVAQWRESGLIGGILLTDKEGTVKFNSNIRGTSDVGASLADRDYFMWAKNNSEGSEYFVGQPVVSRLGGSKGEVIIPVAVPIYRNGVFMGVFASSVKLKPLTERYLELMKVSDRTDVFLVNQEGKILYSHNPDIVGSNISEFFGVNIRNALNTNQEGNFQASYLDPISGKREEHLIAYSPVLLGSQNWLLIMASSIERVGELTAPFFVRQMSILVLVSLTLLLFGIIAVREQMRITPPPDQNQKSLESK